MAESRKGASSTTDVRKKNTLLDDDFGDEFMNSWKSVLVAEDDNVDFSFGTVKKSKNKAFDFESLDVDFNLDGSFEKLSSFKMDIPDLDFSSLPEKAAKDGSSCEEEPNENHQKQIDSLKFSFDFKELDSFDVDKSLENGEMTRGQKEVTKAASSSGVECNDSKIHIAEENAVFDDSVTKTHSASGYEMNSEVETLRRDHGELELEVADDISHGTREAEHTKNEENQFEMRSLSEKHVPKSSGLAMHDIPAQLLGMNDAPKCTSAQLLGTNDAPKCTSAQLLGTNDAPKCTSAQLLGTNDAPKCTSAQLLGMTLGRDHSELELEVADDISHGTREAEHTTNEEDQFEMRSLSEKHVPKSSGLAMHDIPAQLLVLNDAPKCTSFELQPNNRTVDVEISEVSGASEKVTNKIIGSDGTSFEKLAPNNSSPIKRSMPEINHTESDKSGCGPPSEADNIQLAEGCLDVKDRSSSAVSKKLLLTTQKSNENQSSNLELPIVLLCREPLINKVTVKEKEMDRNFLKSRTDKVKKPQLHQASAIRAKFFSLGNNKLDVLNRSPSIGEHTLCRDSIPRNKVAKAVSPVVVESTKSFRELSALSGKVNPSNSCVKTTAQTQCYSELPKLPPVTSQSSKMISAQESKLRYTKTSPKFVNLSSLKISRDGGSQVLSSAGRGKERKLGSAEQIMEAGRSKAVDISFCAENAEKQKLSASNLKRRVEASNADSILLKPLKRLSVSSSGFRNCKESSEKKIEEQVEGMTTNASYDQLASSVGSPHMLNIMDLEISSDLENNRNVEKAEAYTKELEDICNLLRKKCDEADEVLVRAVVNNNNLLLLDHPIYEENIRKAQKFAAKLLSKELRTKAD